MSTEISTHRAGGLALATFDDAYRFAKMVASSDFAPKDFKGKAESCLLAIQHGSEVGLSPMQALQSIAVINGRPTIWGDAALALVQSSPVCEYVREYVEGEGDKLVAVCEAKRRGYPQPTVVRFSMADAKRAGLAGKSGPWTQYPGRMCALRARGFALRNAFADALRGLITAEEAQDYPTTTESPATVERAHAPATAVKAQPPALSAFDRASKLIGEAVSFDGVQGLDRYRKLATDALAEGRLSQDQHDQLVRLIEDRAEELIATDSGVGFPTESAETEAHA